MINKFMNIVGKLATVKRDIKNLNGEEESDSDHILKLAHFTQLVAPHLQTKVDALRMLELALVHDLVEAECGDIPLCAQNGEGNLKELKKQNEMAAILLYKEMLPSAAGQNIYDLFMEYENKTTREAEVVYVLDKLEASFSACRYGDGDIRYWGEGKNGDWYYRTAMNGETPEKKMLDKLQEPFLNQLETMALANCRRAIKKSGIVLEGNFPELVYEPEENAVRIIAFIDELEKICLKKQDTLLPDGQPETYSDRIIKNGYLVLLQHSTDYEKTLHQALFLRAQ